MRGGLKRQAPASTCETGACLWNLLAGAGGESLRPAGPAGLGPDLGPVTCSLPYRYERCASATSFAPHAVLSTFSGSSGQVGGL
jgi:hypothetical protein